MFLLEIMFYNMLNLQYLLIRQLTLEHHLLLINVKLALLFIFILGPFNLI